MSKGETYLIFICQNIKKIKCKPLGCGNGTLCAWKGLANHTMEVDGNQNKDAAWYYKGPSDWHKVSKPGYLFKGV